MISLKRFGRSMKYAFRGIFKVMAREHSFRVQVVAGAIVFIIILFVPLQVWERIVLLLLVGAVLVLEMINSIFERLSDGLKPRLNDMVKDVKDMMAGAVLITAFVACIVAIMILYPYISIYLQGWHLLG
ncbi:diacylglycerol kinase [Patescibacteria group bacterium]|nr:diacylglycerol kinase [Patescibacteria group bacterium]